MSTATPLGLIPTVRPPAETQSGMPLAPVYAPEGPRARLGTGPAPGRARAASRSRADRTRRCTAASRGRCGCSRASARPRTPTAGFTSCSAQGQTGLSTAFDMPTLMGFDPDDPPRALGEVGREGVSVASVADVERLFADIPLDKVTTSMTINAPAVVLLAFYVVAAERRGIPPRRCAARSRTTCSRSSSRRRNGSAACGPACASSATCW